MYILIFVKNLVCIMIIAMGSSYKPKIKYIIQNMEEGGKGDKKNTKKKKTKLNSYQTNRYTLYFSIGYLPNALVS